MLKTFSKQGLYLKKKLDKDYILYNYSKEEFYSFVDYIKENEVYPLENLFFSLVNKLSDLFLTANKVNLVLEFNLDSIFIGKYDKNIYFNLSIDENRKLNTIRDLLDFVAKILDSYFSDYILSKDFMHIFSFTDLRQLYLYSLSFLKHNFLIDLGFSSDIGRVRQVDEDSILISNKVIYFSGRPYSYGLYAISDGMGGHKAGEWASFKVLSFLEKYIWQNFQELINIKDSKKSNRILEILKKVIFQINKDINLWGKKNFSNTSRLPGATLVVLLNIFNMAYLINVGDSRIYLYRDAKLQQLTKDHSVVQMLIDSGDLQKSEAKGHPASSMITSYIGIDNLSRYQISVRQIKHNDIVLLNCDGLTDMVDDFEIERTLAYNYLLPMQDLVELLVMKANSNGGKDNISVVGVKFVANK